MSDTQLLVSVRDVETNQYWAYQDNAACPNLEKTMTGDGMISWSAPFHQFKNTRPPRHAHVEVSDLDGVVQTGRLVRFNPPGTDVCDGDAQYSAEGYAAAGRDRKDTNATPYGPVWTGTSRGLTPEAAVTDALTRWNGVTAGTISPSGFTLPDTESFQGRAAADVANAMAQFGAGLATPIVWTVRKGIFRWGPIDLGAKYQVTLNDGAVITPADDATRLYNHVLVIWGKGQYAEWPTTLSYSQIPTQVTLSVNAGQEVKTPGAALQLAQGLYERLQELELGWSWNFTIPGDTKVDLVGGGKINPYRMDCAQVLRVPDFEGYTRYGAKHGCPNQLVVTSLRWDGQQNQLGGSCGEIRDPSAFVKQVMATNTFSMGSPFTTKPSTVRTVKDAGKVATFGPYVSTATGTAGAVARGAATSPSPIDYRTPAVVSQYNQPPISHEAPKPIKVEKGVQGTLATATGLLDTGLVWSDVPPCEIDTWYLSCTPKGNVTVGVYKATTNSSGFVVDSSGDMTAGTLVLTASISGAKFGLHRFSTSTSPSTNSKPRLTEQSILLYKLTDITSATGWQITMNGNRIVPNHPDGTNTAPALGKASP